MKCSMKLSKTHVPEKDKKLVIEQRNWEAQKKSDKHLQ